MIFVLYGPDDYRRTRAARDIVAEFVVRHPQGARERFDAALPDDVVRFREFARTQSMFEVVKLAIIENAWATENKTFAADLKEFAPRRVMTVICTERTKPAGPFAFLAKPGVRMKDDIRAQEYKYQGGALWRTFIHREAEARAVHLLPDAETRLAEIYENDSWGLVTELDKLSGLSEKNIGLRELEELDLRTAPNFWNIVNGLRHASSAERLAALETIFAEREPANKMLNIISYQTPEHLETFAGYDRAIKSGKLDAEEALLDLAIGDPRA